MNSGGGIHGLDGQIEIVSVFLVNQLDDLDDEFRSIGMDDEDLMILDVISELVHIIHDLFKGRKTAEHFLSFCETLPFRRTSFKFLLAVRQVIRLFR